jgi:hypothetical protein
MRHRHLARGHLLLEEPKTIVCGIASIKFHQCLWPNPQVREFKRRYTFKFYNTEEENLHNLVTSTSSSVLYTGRTSQKLSA